MENMKRVNHRVPRLYSVGFAVGHATTLVVRSRFFPLRLKLLFESRETAQTRASKSSLGKHLAK